MNQSFVFLVSLYMVCHNTLSVLDRLDIHVRQSVALSVYFDILEYQGGLSVSVIPTPQMSLRNSSDGTIAIDDLLVGCDGSLAP